MILGNVTSNLEAMIRLTIEDGSGQTQALDVKIDTGFSDFMSLPIALVTSLGLTPFSHENVQIADGSIVRVDVHSAMILWNGQRRRIDVHALGVDRLIGMRMLVGHELRMLIADGGVVTIELSP